MHPEFGIRDRQAQWYEPRLLRIDDREPAKPTPGQSALSRESQICRGPNLTRSGKESDPRVIYLTRNRGGWNLIGGLDFTAHLNKNWTAISPNGRKLDHGPDDRKTRLRSAGRLPNLSSRGWTVFRLPQPLQGLQHRLSKCVWTIPTTNLNSNQRTLVTFGIRRRAPFRASVLTVFAGRMGPPGQRLYDYSTFAP